MWSHDSILSQLFFTFPLASGGPQKEKNSSWIEDPVQMENSITLKGFCSWNSINVDIMAPKSLKIIELWPLRNFFCCCTTARTISCQPNTVEIPIAQNTVESFCKNKEGILIVAWFLKGFSLLFSELLLADLYAPQRIRVTRSDRQQRKKGFPLTAL